MDIRGIIETERGTLAPQLSGDSDIVAMMADWLAQDNEFFDRKAFLARAGATEDRNNENRR